MSKSLISLQRNMKIKIGKNTLTYLGKIDLVGNRKSSPKMLVEGPGPEDPDYVHIEINKTDELTQQTMKLKKNL